MSLATDLTELITPRVEELGFRLWDLKVTKAGRRSVVTIQIDKAGGATLDEIADLSKLIAPILDDHEALEDAYHLEVSSPGLERNLVNNDHFEWSLGMNITVSFRSEGTVIRKNGKLISNTAEKIVLEEDGQPIEIEKNEITKAHTLFDFEEAMKKGTAKDKIDLQEELQGDVAI